VYGLFNASSVLVISTSYSTANSQWLADDGSAGPRGGERQPDF
jgi:hypothetical protein